MNLRPEPDQKGSVAELGALSGLIRLRGIARKGLATLLCLLASHASFSQGPPRRTISGTITDAQDGVLVGVTVAVVATNWKQKTVTDSQGRFALAVLPGAFTLHVEGRDLIPRDRSFSGTEVLTAIRIQVAYRIAPVRETLVITATALQPEIDRRNDTVYKETLFNRDDQLIDTLAAGINAGQHEGGGKSLEIRRYGFNLDHGGVNGGLKVLVDDVQQNQSTQGHGQGYLGQLKSLSPELVDDVDILSGPFSAEYGDFSGLGVVHIRLKQRLADRFTARIQGGSFGSFRTFLAYSPRTEQTDSYIALEESRTDGPFRNPLNYSRQNLTGNLTRHLDGHTTLGFRLNIARNVFDSSGQIPLDQVWSGNLGRFGYLDPSDGGRVRNGTAGLYFKRDFSSGAALRIDGFATRSLFDLWSNFTFFLNDPIHGDEIQQHDSRMIDGSNLQYLHPLKLFGHDALLTVGGNLDDNFINVGLLHTQERHPLAAVTSADAHVTNVGWYGQQGFDFRGGRVHVDVGLRYDLFRFKVADRLGGSVNGVAIAGNLQPKANIIWTPTPRVPVSLHASYGRGISSEDARGVVQYPKGPKVATTDFYQIGAASNSRRFSISSDLFLIDRSNEQVYVPDDGSFEFKGPSRSYGWESKISSQIARWLSLNGGITQVSNAFYRGISPRLYVDSAPHTVGNAGLTLAGWKGLFSSLRYRHISGYILDGTATYVRGSSADVIDLAVTKAVRKGIEVNLGLDNLTNHRYYETQNYFESRLNADAPPVYRIHATPGYPLGVTVGMTFRFD